MLNRRQFVSGAASLGLLGSIGWKRASSAEPKGMSGHVSLQGRLSKDVFLALVLERFSLLIPNLRATLVLIEVNDAAPSAFSEQFTVVFQGPRDLILLDGTYRVTHRTAWTTDLYLQPAGHDGHYNYYRAVFNLLQ